MNTVLKLRTMVYIQARLRTNFSIFGPTYNYDKISVMEAYKNQLHNGSLLHIQKFVAQQRAHLGGCKI